MNVSAVHLSQSIPGPPDVERQLIEFNWQSRYVEAQRLLDTASQPRRKIRARLVAVGSAAQIIDSFYTTEMPALDHEEVIASEQRARAFIHRTADECTMLLDRASALLLDELLPALAETGTPIRAAHSLKGEQALGLCDYYQRRIFPLLTPQAVDASHPFPHIDDAQLNLLVQLASPPIPGSELSSRFASITIPSSTPRLIAVPETHDAPCAYVWREDTVRHFVERLFMGVNILSAHPFRVLRIKRSGDRVEPMHPHHYRLVSRLDVEQDMPAPVLNWLSRHLHEPDSVIVRSRSPLGLTDLVTIADQLPRQPNWLVRRLSQTWDLFFGHI